MASLNHEINQPLGAIRLNADSLLAEDSVLTPFDRAQMLQQLVAGSEAATQVVRDFRRFFEVNLTPHVVVNLSQLLTDLVRGFRAELDRQGVQVVVKTRAVSVMGDPVQLETALSGVLLFLLKRQSPKTRQMHIQIIQHEHSAKLHMVDDGPALTRLQFEQALDRMGGPNPHPFSQSLWLSRAIIEHHGGTMNAHENNGQSGIVLQLPTLEK